MAESSVEELQRVNPDGKDTHIVSEEVNEHTEYHSSSQQQNKALGQNYCRSMVGQTFEQESSEHIAEPRRVEAEKERFQAYFGNSYTAMTYTEASAAQSKLNNRGSNQQEKSQTSKRIKESGGLEGVSYVEKTLPNPQSTDVNNKRMPKGQYGDVNSGPLVITKKILESNVSASAVHQPPDIYESFQKDLPLTNKVSTEMYLAIKLEDGAKDPLQQVLETRPMCSQDRMNQLDESFILHMFNNKAISMSQLSSSPRNLEVKRVSSQTEFGSLKSSSPRNLGNSTSPTKLQMKLPKVDESLEESSLLKLQLVEDKEDTPKNDETVGEELILKLMSEVKLNPKQKSLGSMDTSNRTLKNVSMNYSWRAPVQNLEYLEASVGIDPMIVELSTNQERKCTVGVNIFENPRHTASKHYFSSDIVLLIENTKGKEACLNTLKEALISFFSECSSHRVSIFTFNSTTTAVLNFLPLSSTNLDHVHTAIRSIHSEESMCATNAELAIENVENVLSKRRLRTNAPVIFLFSLTSDSSVLRRLWDEYSHRTGLLCIFELQNAQHSRNQPVVFAKPGLDRYFIVPSPVFILPVLESHCKRILYSTAKSVNCTLRLNQCQFTIKNRLIYAHGANAKITAEGGVEWHFSNVVPGFKHDLLFEVELGRLKPGVSYEVSGSGISSSVSPLATVSGSVLSQSGVTILLGTLQIEYSEMLNPSRVKVTKEISLTILPPQSGKSSPGSGSISSHRTGWVWNNLTRVRGAQIVKEVEECRFNYEHEKAFELIKAFRTELLLMQPVLDGEDNNIRMLMDKMNALMANLSQDKESVSPKTKYGGFNESISFFSKSYNQHIVKNSSLIIEGARLEIPINFSYLPDSKIDTPTLGGEGGNSRGRDRDAKENNQHFTFYQHKE